MPFAQQFPDFSPSPDVQEDSFSLVNSEETSANTLRPLEGSAPDQDFSRKVNTLILLSFLQRFCPTTLCVTMCMSNQPLYKGSNFLLCCTTMKLKADENPELFPCLPMSSSQTGPPLWGYSPMNPSIQLHRCHLHIPQDFHSHVQLYSRRSQGLSGHSPASSFTSKEDVLPHRLH